jgi:hypothetical protein
LRALGGDVCLARLFFPRELARRGKMVWPCQRDPRRPTAAFSEFHMALALARNETVIKQTGRAFFGAYNSVVFRCRFALETPFLQHRLSPQGSLGLHLTIGVFMIGSLPRYGAGGCNLNTGWMIQRSLANVSRPRRLVSGSSFSMSGIASPFSINCLASAVRPICA